MRECSYHDTSSFTVQPTDRAVLLPQSVVLRRPQAQLQNPSAFVYIEPFIIDGIENTAIPVDKNITLFLSSLTDDSSSSPKEKSVFKEFILPSKYETATNTFSSPKFSLDNVPNGKYQLLLKVDGSLKQLIGIKDITNSNKTLIIQSDEIKLFIGDTNNDNELNILDYAVILNCFESNTFNPICVNSDSADINYDGMVNDADYNLFLKNILVSRAEKE